MESQSKILKNSGMCANAINASDVTETIEPTIATNLLLELLPRATIADSSTTPPSYVQTIRQKVILDLLLDPNPPALSPPTPNTSD